MKSQGTKPVKGFGKKKKVRSGGFSLKGEKQNSSELVLLRQMYANFQTASGEEIVRIHPRWLILTVRQ